MVGKNNKITSEMLGFVDCEDGSIKIEDIVIPPPPVAALSHDVPDKRLIITELRIKNFKSYANEIVLGPFNKNFTAIVGPNGSGKSNVIDSLLFVFGYRAKKIRSKKVSHLIHKSEQYPNVNSCTVTVKFAMIKETGEDFEIIPNTTFIVSRTAFKDDSSFYEMGKKRVPYKEVAKALRQYGIDLEHNRFLILQGEIEAISLMNTKAQNEHECGMLEYIEDIIGSNRYIEPIKHFEAKVEKLAAENKEKTHYLRLVEKERDELEKPKNEAVAYLRLENDLIRKQNELLLCKRFAAEKEQNKILDSINKITDEINKLQREINELKASRKSQEEEMNKISSELDSHVKNYEKFKDAYKNLERRDVEIHEEIKHIKSKKSKADSVLSSTQTELVKLKKQLETHERETEELTKMKEKLEAEKNVEDKKLSEVMDTMQSNTTILQEKKDKLEAVLVKKKKEFHNLQSEKELLQSELKILTQTDAKEKQRLTDMIASLEDAEKNAQAEKALLAKEEQQIIETQAQYEDIMQKISESQREQETLFEQLQTLRLTYDEAKNSLSAYRNKSGVMKAFNEEKARGAFKGVIGRLGDLGAIDEMYDIAISTAAPQLDFILTDNIDTATECVAFLKKKNLGYFTFLALDKQQHYWPQIQAKFSAPENVPRLFDLIRVKDNNVLPGFYHVLRDTLVAKDLEQATRIGLQGAKRYRVVTLKGELIELSGTMSGGGGRPYKGRMGSTVVECSHTPEEVREISQNVDRLTKSVSEIRKSILNMQEQVSNKTKDLARLKLSVKKRQTNYKAHMDSTEMLKCQIEEQKKKVKNSTVDEEKVADLKMKIAEKEKSFNKSAEETSTIEKKVSDLQDEILRITKGSMGKVAKSVEQLNKKIAEISQSITKSIVHAKNCRKNIKKAEEKIKIAEKDVGSADEKREKLKEESEQCVKEAREYLARQEKAQASVEDLKAKKAELKKALETYHEKEHQLKLAEITQKNKLKEIKVTEVETRSAITWYTAEIQKLKLHEVENDSTELGVLSADEMEKKSIKTLSSDLDLIKVQLEEKTYDPSAIAEFKKKEKLCEERQKDLDAIIEEQNLQTRRCSELSSRRLKEFMSGYTAVAKKLKEIYQMLTLGGDAEMELVDALSPFTKGLEYSVRPPRKSWKYIKYLSGGEKTLSSLALVFALHYYRPTPFYVMDEIDAALDVRNVAIVGFFLKERQKNTQFIIVSLRNIMNELSDHLIGIYKTGNTSKNVSIMGASKWKEEDEKASEKPKSKRKSK